jgi:Glycosyltransferase family 87
VLTDANTRRRVRLFLSMLYAGLLAGFLAVLFNYTYEMLTGQLFHQMTHNFPLNFQDFLRFYSIGQIVSSPQRDMVYNPEVQLQFFNALISPAHTDSVMFVQHPPYLFIFFVPFSALPLVQSYALWFVFSIFVGSLVCILLLLQRGTLTKLQIVAFWIGLSVCFPAWRAHYIGQLSWHLLAICGFYCWALVGRRGFLAGISLALATIKIQYLPFLLLPAFFCRSKKILIVAVASFAVLLVIAGFTVGWQNVIGYPHVLLSTESSRDVGLFPERMVCLRGPLSDFPRPIALALSGGAGFIAFIFLTLLWLRVRVPDESQFRWLLSITIVTALIFAPHVHHYDLLLLAIPAALTLETVDPFEAVKIKNSAYKWWTLLLIFFPVISWVICAFVFVSYRFYLLFTLFDIALLLLGLSVLKSMNPDNHPAREPAKDPSEA